jgi:hypothetical protein
VAGKTTTLKNIWVALFQGHDPPDMPPRLLPLRQALTVLRSPVLGGVIVAFFVITRFWQAGFDASLYYLRWPPENATTPYWVYLVTYPLSLIGWPQSWQVLATATIIVASVFYAMRGNRRWWIVVASSPMLYNAWWGQIEIFSLLGLALALVTLQKCVQAPSENLRVSKGSLRFLSTAWLGIAFLALAIKIQTNYGLILVLAWWTWRELGWRALIPAALVCAGVFALTLIIWPGWVSKLFSIYGQTEFGFANATLWPYGLIAWPLALWPVRMNPARRLRLVAAASLLGTPYFTLHHCLVLMTLTDYPVALILSWLPMTMISQTRDWAMYASVLPIGIMAIDLVKTYRERGQNGAAK